MEFKIINNVDLLPTNFIAVIEYKDIPLRGYIHKNGIETAYNSLEDAAKHLLYVYKKHVEKGFVIATVWGINSNKMINLFNYRNFTNWPGNPDLFKISIENGIKVKRDKLTCADAIIILGKEEEKRRKTKSIEEYI